MSDIVVTGSNDLQPCGRLAKDNEVRKAPEQHSPRSRFENREPIRGQGDLLDRTVEFVQETGRGPLTSLPIPFGRRLGLGKSCGVNNDRLTSHCWTRARKRRRASCQGISWAAPLSIS